MKLLPSLLLLCTTAHSDLKITESNPTLKNRGNKILQKIVSKKWAAGWKEATLENVRLVAQKPDLAIPTGLPPVWAATIKGPENKTGRLMWDSSGEGRLVEFSLDDKINVPDVIKGVPVLQQFPIRNSEGKLVASGCVPTSAASLVSYWIANGHPRWSGGEDTTIEDITLRLRKRLKMKLFPDTDGFTTNAMPLAGAFPSELMKALNEDAREHKAPFLSGITSFSMELLKKEIQASRPALLSCTVRVAHKPELSWGHEVIAIGFAKIDGADLVGVLDNFHPTKHPETIRWIRKDAFSSIIAVHPEKAE
jgi:hypothetical protein